MHRQWVESTPWPPHRVTQPTIGLLIHMTYTHALKSPQRVGELPSAPFSSVCLSLCKNHATCCDFDQNVQCLAGILTVFTPIFWTLDIFSRYGCCVRWLCFWQIHRAAVYDVLHTWIISINLFHHSCSIMRIDYSKT